MPVVITKENFDSAVLKSSKPVVVDVYAIWCGPCQQMKPIFEELEKEHSDAYSFATLNVDESRELAMQFGVSSIPTFIFFKKGTMVGKETGYLDKEDLFEKIESYLGGK